MVKVKVVVGAMIKLLPSQTLVLQGRCAAWMGFVDNSGVHDVLCSSKCLMAAENSKP